MKKKVITFLMAVLLVMSSVPLSAEAAEPSGTDNLIEINETNFPDPVFREYLSEEYGDNLFADEVFEIWVAGTEEKNGNIKSLKGIELFPKLTELHCSYNQLSELDISNNPELITLYCDNNQLTSLNLSKNPELDWIECDHNLLTSLDVSNNKELTQLYCDNNQLTSLDVSENEKLFWFSCNSNQLTYLNLGKKPELAGLFCDFNNLTSLDVSNCTELSMFFCFFNELTDLDLSKNTKLTELDCSSCWLENLDLSNNKKLVTIRCYQNLLLTSLDTSNLEKLKTLECDYYEDGISLPSSLENLTLYTFDTIIDFSKIKGINYQNIKDSNYDKTTNKLDITKLEKSNNEVDDIYNWNKENSGLSFDIKFLVYIIDDPQTPDNPQQPDTPKPVPDVNVSYRTHVQSIGWQPYVSDGAMAGTSGQAKRLEGININVAGNSNLGVQYTTHVQSYGWLPWSSNGDMSGTEGEAKRLEAIKIQLTGADKDKYDIYYRVHAQSYGWLGWAMNGAPSGTAGYGKRLEGIQILVVKKGEMIDQNQGGITSARSEAYIALAGSSPVVGAAATSNADPTIGGMENPNVSYRTHVQSFGWQGWKYNGQMSGTSGQAKRLEGINIKLTNKPYSGGICYTTHVQSYGWQGDINNSATWKKDGEMSGTSGQAKRLEAIMIKLTGEMAEHYDVYYRVHAQSYGWLGWAKNGDPAGTAGYAKRLEGIQIVLVPKGGAAPSNSYGGINSTNGQAYIAK